MSADDPIYLNTLVIVLAHGKVADVVARHLPMWQDMGREVFFFTPVDDPLPDKSLKQYSVGKSKAYSEDTNLRCREALRFASMTLYDYVFLCEYDSLVFKKPIPTVFQPTKDGVAAPVFHNVDPSFSGKTYLHFPQLYTNSAVHATVAAMDALPLGAEKGFTDRYVGLAVEKAAIPVKDLNPTGFVYTQNEIDEKKLPEALEAYKKGARWSHGIKTESVFRALRKASFE